MNKGGADTRTQAGPSPSPSPSPISGHCYSCSSSTAPVMELVPKEDIEKDIATKNEMILYTFQLEIAIKSVQKADGPLDQCPLDQPANGHATRFNQSADGPVTHLDWSENRHATKGPAAYLDQSADRSITNEPTALLHQSAEGESAAHFSQCVKVITPLCHAYSYKITRAKSICGALQDSHELQE